MPPAKKSTSRATRSRASSARTTRSRTSSARNSRARVSFKEPAALKKLSKSLESANAALGELQKQSGRDVGKAARDIYKDLRAFLSNASRHSGRLGTALKRDYEKAKSAKKGTSGRSTRTRSSSARAKKPATATARRRSATKTTRSSSRAKSGSKSR
jgi:hypothetical protein